MIAFLDYGGKRLVLEISPLQGEPDYGKAVVLHEKTQAEFRGLNIGATRGARNAPVIPDRGYRLFKDPLMPVSKSQLNKFLPVEVTSDHTAFAENFEKFLRKRGFRLDQDKSLYPLNKNYKAFAQAENIPRFSKMSHYIVGAVGHDSLWEMLQESGPGTRNPYFLRLP